MGAQTDHFGEAVYSKLKELVAARREPMPEPTPVEREAEHRELTQVIEVRAILADAINGWERYLEGRDPTREPFATKNVQKLRKTYDMVNRAVEGSSWQKRRRAVKDVLIAYVWDWLEADQNEALGEEAEEMLSRVAGRAVDLAQLDQKARDLRRDSTGRYKRRAERIVKLALGHSAGA